MGTLGLYSTGTGSFVAGLPDSNIEPSSRSASNSSSPLSIAYSRWIVVMTTLLAGSMAFPLRC